MINPPAVCGHDAGDAQPSHDEPLLCSRTRRTLADTHGRCYLEPGRSRVRKRAGRTVDARIVGATTDVPHHRARVASLSSPVAFGVDRRESHAHTCVVTCKEGFPISPYRRRSAILELASDSSPCPRNADVDGEVGIAVAREPSAVLARPRRLADAVATGCVAVRFRRRAPEPRRATVRACDVYARWRSRRTTSRLTPSHRRCKRAGGTANGACAGCAPKWCPRFSAIDIAAA
jgi:hypothetical protein